MNKIPLLSLYVFLIYYNSSYFTLTVGSFLQNVVQLGILNQTEMGRTCSTYRAIQRCIQSLVGKAEGKRPLGGSRRTWEDNIKIDLREVGYVPGGCLALAQDRDQW